MTKVQKGKAGGCFHSGCLIFFHRPVIAGGFPLLGTEVFNGLVVQQAVHGLLIGIRITVIHLTPQFDPPFGHGEGKPDIKPDGDCNDQKIVEIKNHGEDHAHE